MRARGFQRVAEMSQPKVRIFTENLTHLLHLPAYLQRGLTLHGPQTLILEKKLLHQQVR